MTNPVCMDVIRGGLVEHNWEKYYGLKAGDIFVEVGGFWGRYGVIAARKGCEDVILVEPSPENQAQILQAFEEEPLLKKNGTLVKMAVSDSPGKKRFIVSANPAGHRLAAGASDIPENCEFIDVLTDTMEGILDSLGIDHVDLLASDCENQEVNLVRGLGTWLTEKRVKHFAIGAYHQPGNEEKIMDMFNKAGYTGVCYEEGVVYGSYQ